MFLGSLLLLDNATGTISMSKKYYFTIKPVVLNTKMTSRSTTETDHNYCATDSRTVGLK